MRLMPAPTRSPRAASATVRLVPVSAPLSISTRPPNGRTRSRMPAMPILPGAGDVGVDEAARRHPPPRAARGRPRSALPRRRASHARVARRCSATPASRGERSPRRPAAAAARSAIAHVAAMPFDSLHWATMRSIAAASVVSTSCGGRSAHTRRRISPRLARRHRLRVRQMRSRTAHHVGGSARAVANDSSIASRCLITLVKPCASVS